MHYQSMLRGLSPGSSVFIKDILFDRFMGVVRGEGHARACSSRKFEIPSIVMFSKLFSLPSAKQKMHILSQSMLSPL